MRGTRDSRDRSTSRTSGAVGLNSPATPPASPLTARGGSSLPTLPGFATGPCGPLRRSVPAICTQALSDERIHPLRVRQRHDVAGAGHHDVGPGTPAGEDGVAVAVDLVDGERRRTW